MLSDLERQNAQAQELLSTLEKIKATWESLLSEEEVNDLGKAAGNVAERLEKAAQNWGVLPFGVEQLDNLGKGPVTWPIACGMRNDGH
jgi:hypothetical protein